jgi:hypothetical protein
VQRNLFQRCEIFELLEPKRKSEKSLNINWLSLVA